MPIIKYREILEKLKKKAVFSLKDLHSGGVPKNYAKKLLHTLAKAGKIRRIARDRYTILDDPIAVAPFITSPAYLSLWTAMSIRKLTDQIPFSVQAVTSRKLFRKNFDFAGTEIKFYTAPPRLMFGFENIVWKEHLKIPVANREKIIIDAVFFSGIPEDEILNLVKGCDTKLLKKYAALTGDGRIKNKIKELIEKCSRRKK